ncbi:MAG: hypothetical protein WCR46_18545 [Deltaproteobacteria bacterium]|jgi:hypothetical protein
MKKKLAAAILTMALFCAVPRIIQADSIGVFCWTLTPYDNILCFNVDTRGFAIKLTGTDKTPDVSIDGAYGAAVFDNAGGYSDGLDQLWNQLYRTYRPEYAQ